jgi:hypothetical protein
MGFYRLALEFGIVCIVVGFVSGGNIVYGGHVFNRFHMGLAIVAALSFSLLVWSNYLMVEVAVETRRDSRCLTAGICNVGQTQSRVLGRGGERRREGGREGVKREGLCHCVCVCGGGL